MTRRKYWILLTENKGFMRLSPKAIPKQTAIRYITEYLNIPMEEGSYRG